MQIYGHLLNKNLYLELEDLVPQDDEESLAAI